MAFPIIPILLLGVVGGGLALAFAKGGKGSDKTVVKNGVEYGPQCRSVKVIDPEKWMASAFDAMLAAAKKVKPSDRAIDALASIYAAALPGPGCNWSSSSFECTMIDPTGKQVEWSSVRALLGDMSAQEADESGVLTEFFQVPQQQSGGPQGAPLSDRDLGFKFLAVRGLIRTVMPTGVVAPYNPPAGAAGWVTGQREYYSYKSPRRKDTVYIMMTRNGSKWPWAVYIDAAAKVMLVEANAEQTPWNSANYHGFDDNTDTTGALRSAMEMIDWGGPDRLYSSYAG